MSTHNIGFYEDLTKIIFELSSNIIKYAPYFFCCSNYKVRITNVSVSDSYGTFQSEIQNEPRREETGLRGFRPCPTQTRLYNHRR